MLEILKSTLTQILASYSQYVGNGMYMLLLFVSFLYIYITDRSKERKVLFCYYPVLVLAVIFNPLIAKVIINFIDGSVYWRMFWTLPITVVIAYAATTIFINISDKYRKLVVILALTAIMIMSGKFIFTAANYSTPTNWYKLPEQTITICNILETDCTGVIRVVVPPELEVSIRQYDANIQMVYGRDGKVNTYDSKYGDRIALVVLMRESELNVDAIRKSMINFQCNYLVVNKNTLLSDSLGKYGYYCVASTKIYNIYRFNSEEVKLIDS